MPNSLMHRVLSQLLAHIPSPSVLTRFLKDSLYLIYPCVCKYGGGRCLGVLHLYLFCKMQSLLDLGLVSSCWAGSQQDPKILSSLSHLTTGLQVYTALLYGCQDVNSGFQNCSPSTLNH